MREAFQCILLPVIAFAALLRAFASEQSITDERIEFMRVILNPSQIS